MTDNLPEGVTQDDIDQTAAAIPVLVSIASGVSVNALSALCKELQSQHGRIQAIGFMNMNPADYGRKVEEVRFNLDQASAMLTFVKAVQKNLEAEKASRERHAVAQDNYARLNKALGLG